MIAAGPAPIERGKSDMQTLPTEETYHALGVSIVSIYLSAALGFRQA
jgi:hypothetical protein